MANLDQFKINLITNKSKGDRLQCVTIINTTKKVYFYDRLKILRSLFCRTLTLPFLIRSNKFISIG